MDCPVRVCQGLPAGTSGDVLTDFNVQDSTLSYKGRETPKTAYPIAHISLIKTMAEPQSIQLASGNLFTYEDATATLSAWLSDGNANFGAYSADSREDMERLQYSTQDGPGRREPKQTCGASRYAEFRGASLRIGCVFFSNHRNNRISRTIKIRVNDQSSDA